MNIHTSTGNQTLLNQTGTDFIHTMQIVGLHASCNMLQREMDFMRQIFKRPIPHLCLQEIFLALSLDQPETLHKKKKKVK